MNRTTCLTILLLACTLCSYAQGHVFTALAVKGESRYVADSVWNSIEPGTKISLDGKIDLGPDVYLALVHINGHTFEIQDSGSFYVTSLDSIVQSLGQSDLLQNYSEFVLKDMKEGDTMFKSYTSPAQIMGEFGNQIKLLGPTNDTKISILFNRQFTVRWIPFRPIEEYTVFFRNLYHDSLIEKDVSYCHLTLNLTELAIPSQELPYMLLITDKHNPNVTSCNMEGEAMPIYVLGRENTITKKSISLMKVIDHESPLDNLVLASFFDRNGLKLHAVDCFVKAIELQPDFDYFRKVYKEYLNINGLNPDLLEKVDELESISDY